MMSIFAKFLKIRTAFLVFCTGVGISTASQAAILADTDSFVDTSAYTADFTAIPPFLEEVSGNPSVILAFDVSGSMLVPAYPEEGKHWRNDVLANFDPDKEYFGYFQDASMYRYDDTNEFFIEDAAGDWDGGFLNWLTMRRVDVAREVMIGGKAVDRDGIDIAGTTYYVIEGELEVRSQDDYSKQYSASSTVSPIPDDAIINISGAKINAEGLSGSSTDKVAISDKFEIGYLDARSWETADYTAPNTWPEINFINNYTAPAVVAVAVSNNGGDSSIARAFDVSGTSARLGLLEWKSTPDNHGAEDFIFYMVAETSDGNQDCHDVALSGGNTMQVCAGRNSTNQINTNVGVNFDTAFPGGSNPAVFAGVSSYNNNALIDLAAHVNTRLAGTTFNLLMSRRTGGVSVLGLDEEMHWIAVQETNDTTAAGVLIQMDELSVGVSRTTTATFPKTFGIQPLVAAAAQTYLVDIASGDASHFMRIGEPGSDDVGDGWSTTEIEMELQTADNSNPPVETVAYMAVGGAGAPRIRLALEEEPTGLVQENSSTVNFGLSVYNFDHRTNNINNIVSGNKVQGGTMYPCYPIINDPDREEMRQKEYEAGDSDIIKGKATLYDGSEREYFCIPTSVHTPNSSIVKVIEDYPLIWGTTPIAESLVDIGRYVRQDARGPFYPREGTTDRAFSNEPDDPFQIEVFGLDGTASANGVRWDPYFDVEQNQALDCKKVFALHFNDGAPYRDFDGTGHPEPNAGNTNPDIYDIDNDSHGQNEALDNVALALRANDCRDPDLGGHQEVISYFVYADLGTNEEDDPPANASIRRMREAAARGGFVDSNGDNLPDPMHPTNDAGAIIDFNTHAARGTCDPNEWDSDGDCEPDTFYFATDGGQIKDQLQAALDDILARVASGGAASVISTTANGEGAVFQSQFIPKRTVDNVDVTWIGDIAAIMIDEFGYLRTDGDDDDVLDDYTTDPIIFSCYDAANKVARFKFVVWDQTNEEEPSRPTDDQFDDCIESVFNKLAEDVNPIWNASESLSTLVNDDIPSQRGTYASSSKNRFVRTALPDNTGDLVVTDFIAGTFTGNADTNYGLLDTDNDTDAERLVNFTRGYESTDVSLRSRVLNEGEADETIYRLGDVIYSTPIAVGRPSENLNLLYEDDTYNTFARYYRDRRTMLYVGANDGMIHSFNAGWYDRVNRKFEGSNGTLTYWDLGQEVWSFVPYNLLPHLKYLSDPTYGENDGDHMYMVDQTPYVFDARIFSDTATEGIKGQTIAGSSSAVHPEGWGTVMVVGFRTGGGTVDVYPDPADTSTSVTLRPSYLIFDITDPEIEPALIGEFTHEDLGFSMVNPTALTIVQSGADPETDWFLMFGSGASATPNGAAQVVSEQNAHLFLYNLKTNELQTGASFGTDGVLDLAGFDSEGAANAFVGGISAADWDLDRSTDALYFGTVQGLDTIENATNTVWPDADNNGIPDGSDGTYDEYAGKLYRVRVEPGSSASLHSWYVEEVYDAEDSIASRPSLSFDENLNRWLHFATGRYFTSFDHISDTDGFIAGIKEPRNTSGEFAMETTSISTAVPAITNDVVDTTDSTVVEGTGALSGSVSVPATMAEDTVTALMELQMAYNDAANYLNGWKRDFDVVDKRGERGTGDSLVLGGFVFQTTFAPDIGACLVTGESNFWALHYLTGTGWRQHAFGDPDETTDNSDTVEVVQKTGSTNSSTPGIHLGEKQADGGATVQINKSGTDASTIELENLQQINSKEVSWREL